MTEVISRLRIAQDAANSAALAVLGLTVGNPYPPDSEAHMLWCVSFKRASTALLEDCEASA